MMLVALTFFAVCFLAYSNGANDNFKGVASLFGSRTCGYRTAITWATVTTSVGSVAAIFLAQARQAKWNPVLGVLASWVVTLPCAAIIAGLIYWLIDSH